MSRTNSSSTEEKTSIFSFVKEKYLPQLLILMILLICSAWFVDWCKTSDAIAQYQADKKTLQSEKKELTDKNATLMTEAEQKDKDLQKAMRQIEAGKKKPENNYYVSAATAKDAAQQIKEDLRKGDPSVRPIMEVKGDYTLVQPFDDKQQVNIYRVNKDNPRMLGFNVSNNSKSIVAGYDRVLLNYGRENGTKKKLYGVTYMVRW